MSINLKHSLWVERYRPHSLDEYVFHDPLQHAKVLEMIEEQTIPHILMSGIQGSGKTTLAFLLMEAMNIDESDIRVINASDENSVDVMREKIKDFVSTAPMGLFKIILLEEADYISHNGQAVMRRLMEEYSENARFIITCNYLHKIIPSIQSRFTVKWHFKASDKDDVTEYAATVLANEKVSFDLDTLDQYVNIGYPDVRSIIGSLQQYTVGGKLYPPANTESTSNDYKFKLIDCIEQDKWVDARKLVCANVQKEEYEEVYRFLYEQLSTSAKFKDNDKWDEGIIIIADHLYRHASVADAEINTAAMFIRLGAL